jgi:hypothetical protein
MKKRILIQQVKGNSDRSFILRPNKLVVEVNEVQETSEVKEEPVFKWMPCVLCESPFPNMDVILAPCMCLYHPWCIIMQNWVSDSCAREDCKKMFGEA